MTVRVRLIEVEGSPEEIRELDLEGLLREEGGSRNGDKGVETPPTVVDGLSDEVRSFVDRKSGSKQQADLFRRFIAEAVAWKAVRAKFGSTHRDGEPRYLRLNRVPEHKGAFAYVNPRYGRLQFRLKWDETPSELRDRALRGSELAYGVRIMLDSEEDLSSAVQLARLAYERAVKEPEAH
jgi:hypothetical protein